MHKNKLASMIMLLIKVAVLLITVPPSAMAAESDIIWKRNFGGSYYDYFESVAFVPGGIVAVGYSDSSSIGDWETVSAFNGLGAIIVKYDDSGNVLWKDHFGGNHQAPNPYLPVYCFNSVAAVYDGIVAVGMANSDLFKNDSWEVEYENMLTNYGADSAIIVKYDNNGNVVWKKNSASSGHDRYNSVMAVYDGIVAVGSSQDGAIIVKYSNNGDIVWEKNFGGSGSDAYNSVIVVSDGLIAVGDSYSSSFGNGDWAGVAGKGGFDAIIVKYDNDGNLIWKKNFGGNGLDVYNSASAVSGGIIVVGESYSDSFGNGDWVGIPGKGGVNDAIIVKYDDNGNVVWKKNFGGNGVVTPSQRVEDDSYTSIATVSDGVIAVGCSQASGFGSGDWVGVSGIGEYGWNAIVVKYDIDGNIAWKKNAGAGEYTSVAAGANTIAAVGHSWLDIAERGDWERISGYGCEDAIIAKYSIDGASAPIAEVVPPVTPVPVTRLPKVNVYSVYEAGTMTFESDVIEVIETIIVDETTVASVIERVFVENIFREELEINQFGESAYPLNGVYFKDGVLTLDYSTAGSMYLDRGTTASTIKMHEIIRTVFSCSLIHTLDERVNGKIGASVNHYTFKVTGRIADYDVFISEEAISGTAVPNKHSEWAQPELERAAEINLIPDSLVAPDADYTKPITRAEFAGIAVRTYEILATTTVLPATNDPFTDTWDTDALRAFNAGLMVGVSETEFAPSALLNREQCATALTRVFKRSTMPGWTFADDANYPLNFTHPELFSDDSNISDWAREGVYFMASHGIILGIPVDMPNNAFAPRAMTSAEEAEGYATATREQALIIAVRMIDNLKETQY